VKGVEKKKGSDVVSRPAASRWCAGARLW
jgi:hypothetical protein